MAKTKLTDYEKAKQHDYGKEEEILSKCDKLDRYLAKKNMVMKIWGKAYHHLTVLVPKQLEEAIDVLVAHRAETGNQESSYLFPSKNSPVKCMDPWAPFRELSKQYGLKNPDLMRGTNLRKAFATSLHCFNMTPSEMKKAASFMGHSLDVHDNYYKLPDNTYDVTKIGNTLLFLILSDTIFKRHLVAIIPIIKTDIYYSLQQ